MPVVTPIASALRDQPLETVIEAMAAVAETLARLHALGIGHRDIKPGNLYSLDGKWLVGDFGLVAVPDVESLTESGRPLGPAHFTPYEMIRNPDTADAKMADVFSLAKTVWVLATAQRFPPEGHQPTQTVGFGINNFRAHPNAHLVDSLIDRCTRIHPVERPAMAQVADDLRRWLALPEETKAIDIGVIRMRLRTRMESRLAADEVKAQRKEMALAAARRLGNLVAPLNQALRDLHPQAEIDGHADRFTQNILRTGDELSNSPDIAWRMQRRSSITVGERPMEFELCFSRTLELTEEGELILFFGIYVDYVELNGMNYEWLELWTAPVGVWRSRRCCARRRPRPLRTSNRRRPCSPRLSPIARSATTRGGCTANEAVDGAAPIVENLDGLAWVAREVNATHVVALDEWVESPRLVVFHVEADQASTAAALQVARHLVQLGANDLSHHRVLGELSSGPS